MHSSSSRVLSLLNRLLARRSAARHFNLVEPLEARIAPAAISWDGGGGDLKWSTPVNWSGDALPTANDDVTIDVPGLITVTASAFGLVAKTLSSTENLAITNGSLTLSSTSSISGDLTLSGAELVVNGALAVNGAFNFNGEGYLHGTGTTTLAGTSTFGVKVNIGGNVTNNGTISIPAVDVIFSDNATLTNAVGGTINASGVGSITGAGVIENAGTFNQASGYDYVQVSFNNTGALNLHGGTIEFKNRGTSSGIFDVDAGATLLFTEGTGFQVVYHLTPGAQLNGAGLYRVDAFGWLQVAAGLTITPKNLEIDSFSFVGGDGNTTIQNGSVVTWAGGSFIGTGKTTIAAGGIGNMTSSGGGTESHLLDVFGTLNLNAAGFSLHNASTLNIMVGGVMNAYGRSGIIQAASVLNILGTLNVDAAGTFFDEGATTTSLSGTVHVISGNLSLPAGISSTGTFLADAGAFVSFNGRTATMNPGTQWNGPGHYYLNAGAVVFATGVAITVQDLHITNGTLANFGTLNIPANGALDFGGQSFASASISGSGVTNIAATAAVTGAGVLLGGTFNNSGTVTTQIIQGGTFNNLAGGVTTFTPSSLGYGGYLNGTFNNSGTLNFDASGPEGSIFNAKLQNNGLVSVTGGEASIDLNDPFDQSTSASTGEFRTVAGASIFFNGSPFTFNAGATLTGAGTFRIGDKVTLADAALNFSPAHLVLTGSIFGPGKITASAGDVWTLTGGVLSGLGEFDVQAGAKITLGSISLSGTNLRNFGEISSATAFGALNLSLGVTVTNEAGATLAVDPPTDSTFFFFNSGTLVNHGLIKKGTGGGTLTIFGGFDNPGTLEIDGGLASLNGFGLAQISADNLTLTGGTWKILGGAKLTINGRIDQPDAYGNPLVTIVNNAADVTLSGAGAGFNAVNNLATNSGALRVLGGAVFSTALYDGNPPTDPHGPLAGPLTNTGTLEIGANSTVNVTADFTQTAAGALTLHIAGGGSGKLAVTGNAALDGSLALQVDGVFVPPIGAEYVLATYAGTTGDFAVLNGVLPLFTPLKTAAQFTATVQNIPSDLVPTALAPPASGVAGQPVTINFSVKNFANVTTAANAWTDSIYLSTSATFDASALLLGRVPHAGALAAGASYNAQFTGDLPALLPGAYHVFILTDSRAQVAESDNANNLLAAAGTIAITVPELTPGTTFDGTIADGHEQLFHVSLPPGASHFVLTGAVAGEAELYVGRGSVPSSSHSDFFVFDPAGTAQSITVVESANAGDYVLVRGRENAGAGTAFHLTAEPLAFSLESAGPLAATNNGEVTLTLHGTQFSAATAFSLKHGADAALAPTRVQLRDSTTAFVTFDLHSVVLGSYDVRAQSGATLTTLAAGFNVLAAPLLDPDLQINLSLIVPSGIRIGRVSTLLVSYNNPTAHDLPAPLLVLSSSDAAFQSSWDAEFRDKFIEFFATDPNGPSGILPAGFHGSAFFKFLPLVEQAGMRVSLQVAEVDPTALLDQGKLEIEARHTGEFSDVDWALVKGRLVQQLGPTYGDYERTLRSDIALLPPGLGESRVPVDLLEIEVLKAAAATHTSISGTLGAAPAGVVRGGALVSAHNADTGEDFFTTAFNDGSFIFDTVTPGHFTFAFENALVSNATPFVVANGAHLSGVALALAPGAAFSGALTASESGAALSGARVVAVAADGSNFGTQSDADGHYRFGALPAGNYTLIVDAAGRARDVVAGVAVAVGENVDDLALSPQATISGHVSPHAGGQLGSTTVTAESAAGAAFESFSAVADASGNFTIGGLPAGSYRLHFSHAGYVAATLENVVVASGGSGTVADTPLLVAGSISGALTSDVGAAGGVSVGAFSGGKLVATAITGTGGTFTIGGLAPGSYVVKTTNDAPFETAANATLTEGQTLNGIALNIEPGGVLSGTVHDSTNAQPLANQTVVAIATGGALLTTKTDAAGHYVFEHLATGAYTVLLPSGSAQSSTVKTIASLHSAITADLTTTFAAHLGGHLLLPDHSPVTGAFVELHADGRIVASATTGADGAYRFDIASAGTFTLSAIAPTATFADSAPLTIAAGANATQDLTSGNGTLALTFTDAARPLAGAHVALIEVSSGHAVAEAALDASGALNFSHLAAGNYRVIVTQSGARGALATVAVAGSGTTSSIVPFAAQGAITGHVTGLAAGAGAQVTAYSTSTAGIAFSTQVADDGSYSFANLPVGNYSFVVVSSGKQVAAQSSNVAVSGAMNLDVSFASGGTLVDGTIVDASGNLLPNAIVQFLDPAGQVIGQTKTDANGAFELRLESGMVKVRVFPPSQPQFDFLNTLQINMPNSQDDPQRLDPLALGAFSNVVSDAFDIANATISGFGIVQATDALEGYKVIIDELGRFMESKDHVFSIPAAPQCKDCNPDPAIMAKSIQDARFGDWQNDLKKLVVGVPVGLAAIKTEALKNLGFVLQTIQLGTSLGGIFAEAKAAALLARSGGAISEEAGVVVQKTLAELVGQATKDFSGVYTAAQTVINQARDGFQPNDDPDQTLNYLNQIASGTANVSTLFASFADTLRNIVKEDAQVLGKFSAGLGLLGTVLGLKDSLDALNYTNSITRATKLAGEFKTYKADHKIYEAAATKARMAENKYEECLAKSSADPNCQPKPNPNGPGRPAPNRPGGGTQTGNSTQGFSFDPNDIVGPAGSGLQHFVGAQTPLPYTIHFENQAGATAAAAEVKVTQQLDGDLDFASLRLTEFGFGGRTFAVPEGRSSFSERLDLRSELGVFVDFEAGVNVATGQVHWSLAAIDPLTGDVSGDASHGVLPPNVNGTEGEGFVSYSVQAKAGAHTGDLIEAQASIVFDANAAINTPSISNTIDAVAPDAHVNVIAANGKSGPDFTVSWTGSDDAGGSGLATFDVFVHDKSVAGSKFEPLALGTSHHAAIFSGTVGHTYEFIALGTDGAGNHEALPIVADASVEVIAGATPFTLDALHPVSFHGADGKLVTVTLAGHGTGAVTLVHGVADAADIRTISLTGTDADSTLKIKTQEGGHVNVGRIITTGAAGALGSLKLKGGAVLGDGFDDTAPDVIVGGAMNTFIAGDVAAFTQIKIGTGLTDRLAAKSTLAFSMHNALGEGITTDIATKVGVAKVNAWAFDGLFGARQSVGEITIDSGDFKASVNVDGGSKFASTATLGPVTIGNGGLLGTSFDVEGALSSVTVKGTLDTQLKAASIGPITAGTFLFANVKALIGDIGKIKLTSGPLLGSTITAPGGVIGNIKVELTKQSADVNAIDGTIIDARGVGNITASISGSMTSARAIENSFIRAATGNIGSISAAVSGTALVDGHAIDHSFVGADLGAIGAITASASSSAANATLAAIRASDFNAHTDIGNVTAIAAVTNKTPLNGRAAGIQAGDASGVNFNAGASIGKIIASAKGAAQGNVALEGSAAQRVNFNAGTSLAGVALTVGKGHAASASNSSAAFASIFAGAKIGTFTADGDATATQLDNVVVYAGGSIASIAISANAGTFGTATNSFFFAGQSRPITTAQDLVRGSLGELTLTGSLINSQIVATGNIGPISIGGDALSDQFVAGVDVGDDTLFLTGDDSYNAHASIASVTVVGRFATSTVVAGIDPGAGFVFGDGNDIVGTVTGFSARSSIGPVKIGAASVSGGSLTPMLAVGDHTAAIESLTLTSVRIGTGAIFKQFGSSAYIDSDGGGTEGPGDILVRKIS